MRTNFLFAPAVLVGLATLANAGGYDDPERWCSVGERLHGRNETLLLLVVRLQLLVHESVDLVDVVDCALAPGFGARNRYGRPMLILAIDTALEMCAAAVLDTEPGKMASESLPMVRGHAEAVVPLIQRGM